MSADSPPRWKEPALAFLLFTLSTLAFLWPALAHFDDASYTSADLSQMYSLTTVSNPIRPGNVHLSDPVVEMLPWLEFNKNELRQGRLPTWNPLNGAGVPHLANYQSAVFSPFSLPFYFAPLKWALLLSAFLKLVGLGIFTFLFLRALGASFGAACVGGTIFEFGGHNVLLLAYPHSAVAVGFPAALWAVERAWQSFEVRSDPWLRRILPWACALAIAVACMLFAGSPETAAFAIATVAIYALARAVVSARTHGQSPRACLRVLLGLGLAALIGLAIAAVQVIPFFEYAARSTLIESRGSGFDGLRSANWPLQFFPDLFGNPTQPFAAHGNLPLPNYEAANTAYFGSLTWLFAIVGTCLLLRSAPVRFFALLALAWCLCAFDFEWMRPAMIAFTAWTHAPVNRSQLVPLLALAVLAALAIDALRPREGRASWVVFVAVCAFAAAALWLAHRGAARLVAESYPGGAPAGWKLWVPPHLQFIQWSFAAGTLAFAALVFARAKWMRSMLVAATLVIVFAQSGWVLRGINSLSRDEHVFPRTPALETIAAAVGNERLQVIGEDTLPPQMNMSYGIASVSVYDALCVAKYDRLYRTLFKSEVNWRETLFTSEHALELLGIRYLLARDDWPRLDPGIAIDPEMALPVPQPLPLRAGADVVQTFRVEQGGLDRVIVALGAEDDPIPAFAELVLEDAENGAQIAKAKLDTHSLRAGLTTKKLTLFPHDLRFSAPTGWMPLAFEPQEDSAGRSYRLRLRTEAGAWTRGFIAWTVPDEAADQRELRSGAEKVPSRLCLDWAANAARDLEVLARFDPFTLYRFERGHGRFWIARETRLAPDEDRAFQWTLARDHDPAAVAILEGVETGDLRNLGETPFEPSPKVIEESSRRIVLEVDSPRDAWLIAALAWYPGWRARVDGEPVALAKANYAFLAAPVPGGKHRVEFEFDSFAVRLGAWTSILGLIALVAAGCCFEKNRDHRSAAPGPRKL